MALAIPNHPEGYVQVAITDVDIWEVFGLNYRGMKEPNLKQKYAFNHTAPKHYDLVDRWRMNSGELDSFLSALEAFSPNWYRNVRGKLINLTIKRLVIVLRHPMRYNYQAEYIFASSFSYLRVMLTQNMWQLQKYLPKEQQVKPYSFKISKAKLIMLSKLFADALMDDAIKIKKKYDDVN